MTKHLPLLVIAAACAALLMACLTEKPGGGTAPVASNNAPNAAAGKAAPITPKPATPTPVAVKPKPKPTGKEVVFDPDNPPEGLRLCHRNHCHRNDGSVVSYAVVMREMGATRIKGQAAAPKMPPAPKDVAAPPADAKRTQSGLAYKVMNPGKGGPKPKVTDRVTVHYTGWTTDGKAFDSSLSRGRPASFQLNRVIPGWTEGLQLMSEGAEYRFWIPQEIAYNGKPGRPAGMLVFDVVLLKVQQ